MAKKTMVEVLYDNESGKYSVNAPKGISVGEIAFSISVVIKCLVRDKYVDSIDTMIDTIKNYSTDPQFEEVKEIKEEKEDVENVKEESVNR